MSETIKANHRVNVVRINEIIKHPNADTLGLVKIDGYQVVVKSEEHKVGELCIYVQPDSVVPERKEFSFLYLDKKVIDEPVPAKYRRVKARKFRGEWSEGLLLPASEFPELYYKDYDAWYQPVLVCRYKEGDNVAEVLGITHYEPPEPEEYDKHGNKLASERSHLPRSLKGWLHYFKYRFLGLFGIHDPLRGYNEKGPELYVPVYDVEAFKNYVMGFQPGEQVLVTEKIHGANARYVYLNGKIYAGSRKLWKHKKTKCIWNEVLAQNPWITQWCKDHEGHVLYGEVVPCQKMKGAGQAHYGNKNGKVNFYAFDIYAPDGEWLSPQELLNEVETCHIQLVPVLYNGPFDLEKIKNLVEGKSTLTSEHVREGIVIKPFNERTVHNLGRLQLKIVSNQFLLESE